MRRTHRGITGTVLCLLLLAGCGSSDAGGTASTEEALLGGIETVAPDAMGPEDEAAGLEDDGSGLTAQSVVDAIMSAGTYTCTPVSGAEWECAAEDPEVGAVQVTGSSSGDLTVTGEAPIDAGTVSAIAELVGADVDDLYSDDAGLAWAAS